MLAFGGVGFLFYGGMTIFLITGVGSAARRVENVSPGEDASDVLSGCQRVTLVRTVQTWFVGGGGYAVTTSLVAIGTAAAITHLLITVLIAGTPSLIEQSGGTSFAESGSGNGAINRNPRDTLGVSATGVDLGDKPGDEPHHD